MRLSGSTAALVALEDRAPDALFATLPGTDIPLWPLLRWPFSEALMLTQYEGSLPPRHEGAFSKATRFARTALPSSDWSRSLRGPREVLFFGTGSRNVPTPAGIANPLLGPFAETLGDRAVMMQYEPIPRGRRHAFEPTATFEDAVVASELRARLHPVPEPVIRQTRAWAEDLFGMVEHPIDPGLRATALRTFGLRVARAPSFADSYGRLLDRLAPRVLVLQQAAYGDRSVFVRAAHERGILVAEPQHGWLGGAHGAYHFGGAASDPRLRSALPDTLLTFGQYWSDAVSAPFDTVAVGRPGLEDAGDAAPALDQRPRDVVVVSTVVGPDALAAFTLRLHDALPEGWRVKFRLHPKERGMFAELYPSLAGRPGIDLDTEPDPHVSFGTSRIMVSASSTSLYEAIALRTPVVVRETSMSDDYIDPAIFPNRIAPGADPSPAIRRAIEHPGLDLPASTVERVWADGSRERFRRWAEAALAPTTTKDRAR